jgi:hypothetical protein
VNVYPSFVGLLSVISSVSTLYSVGFVAVPPAKL